MIGGKGAKVVPSRGTKVQKRRGHQSSSNNDNASVSISNNKNKLFNHASHLKTTHMNDLKKRRVDFFNRINYHHTLTTVVIPVLTILYLVEFSVPIIPTNSKTFIFSCIYFNFTLLAFTSGYHKCFGHNCFRSRFKFLHLYFAVFGSSIGLGSIRWWASLHRAHHQFTDNTERDPYSIKRGFFWSHWGWLVKKPKNISFYDDFIEHEFPQFPQPKDSINEVDKLQGEIDEDFEYEEADILKNVYDSHTQSLIIWQDKLYPLFFFITTFLFPIVITVSFCEDNWINGLLYPGIIRMIICQQTQLSTESICHFRELQVTIPTQPFNDKNSSLNCNNPLVSILTYGQSLQNYHHEFPHDYRSSSSLFAFDPTKWFIWTLSHVGLIEEVCTTPKDLITQLRIQQQQEVINRMKSQLNWGTPISKLPIISPRDFRHIINSPSHADRLYIVIQNIIHDITPFMDQHPGGVPLLKASRGKDATKAFYGGVYGHLTAAVNLLATMRIGVLDLGNDEDIWRRVASEEGEIQDNDSRRENKLLYRSAEAA